MIIKSHSTNFQLPAEAISAAEHSKVIEAIKIVSAETGLGLKEAKEAVAAYMAGKSSANLRTNTIVKPQNTNAWEVLLISILLLTSNIAVLLMTDRI